MKSSLPRADWWIECLSLREVTTEGTYRRHKSTSLADVWMLRALHPAPFPHRSRPPCPSQFPLPQGTDGQSCACFHSCVGYLPAQLILLLPSYCYFGLRDTGYLAALSPHSANFSLSRGEVLLTHKLRSFPDGSRPPPFPPPHPIPWAIY